MAKQSLFCKTTVYQLLKKREPLFSGWKVAGFIGAGVSGCVFKMQRDDLGETFHAALKVIPLTRKLDSENRTMDSLKESIGQDAREIIHLYSLGNHQNVVGWYNHEVFHERDQDSIIALVTVMMEYLPRTLASLIKKGALPWEHSLEILIDCLKGLEHVHGKQILHRDIKPGNIFITKDGVAKIGDFGVARKLSEASFAETRVGTPLYIAPEVLRDPLGTGYAHQVDIYSLALVGYEMLHGSLPFEDLCQGNRTCMVNKRLAGEPIILDPSLPPGVTKALLAALAYRASQRYATAREFRLALQRALETGGRESIPPRSQSVEQDNKLEEKEYGIGLAPSSVHEGQDTPPAKPEPVIQHYAGEDLYPSGQEQFTSKKQSQPQQDGVLGLVHSPAGIIAGAAVGCAAAYLTRDVDMEFSVVFILFYLALPLYLIAVGTAKRGLFAALAFFLSLSAYNLLSTGQLSGLLDVYNGAIGLLYLAVLGVLSWLRKRE